MIILRIVTRFAQKRQRKILQQIGGQPYRKLNICHGSAWWVLILIPVFEFALDDEAWVDSYRENLMAYCVIADVCKTKCSVPNSALPLPKKHLHNPDTKSAIRVS